MIKAILIDDEAPNVENLTALLKRHCPAVEITASATTVSEAAELIRNHHPDLVFLDIQMGNETGFDLLEMLPEKNFEVIFATAFDNHGIRAVKFAALDYLLKPIDIDELKAAVNKAVEKIKAKQQTSQIDFLLQHLQRPAQQPVKIALPQQQEIRYVWITDIVRCQADNTYTYFFLTGNEKVLISKSLKEYAELLQPHGFIRSHQSHLVNPAYVKSWLKEDGGVLMMNTGEKIPVSKPNREKVKVALSF